jgi:hypothetical protein
MIFLITSLVMLAVFLRPPTLSREYIFSLAVISVAAATSVYETMKVFSQEVL